MIKEFAFLIFTVILILFLDHCGTKNISRYIQRNVKIRFFKKEQGTHDFFYSKNNQKHNKFLDLNRM